MTELSTLLSPLERAIQCLRQGQYAEGIALMTFVRARLSPDQLLLATSLDTLIQSLKDYLQATQALHLASKAFTEAEGKQETQIALLETLLPTLCSEVTKVPMDELPAGQTNGLAEPQPPPALSPKPMLSLTHAKAEAGSDVINNKYRAHLEPSSPEEGLPDLHLRCFGCFEVRRGNQLVTLCHNRCGQEILRYLGTRAGYRASRDMLMEVFWRDGEPAVARHKLEVAVSALRRSLNYGYACHAGGGYIVCKGQIYQLSPAVTIHSDVDEFLSLWQAGLQSTGSARVAFYEQACALRSGPFLVEDLYADWSFMRREQLNQAYLNMCHTLADYYLQIGSYEHAAKWANAKLNENRFDEVAQQLLMHIYVSDGRRSEAIRKYQLCECALMEEGLSPMHETTRLFQALLAGEDLSLEKKSAESIKEQA